MRRNEWLTLGLIALAAMPGAAPADSGRPYQILGEMAAQHRGRLKPLDTLAREEVKQIHGRETITLKDARGKALSTWGPVAALIDWQARPDFWDDQDIILLGGYGEPYQPLKQAVLAGAIRSQLVAVADRSTTPAAEAKTLRQLADRADALETADLIDAANLSSPTFEDKANLNRLAAKLDLAHKWLSPSDLESAEVTVDGRKLSFFDWFGEVLNKRGDGRETGEGAAKLSTLEKRVIEAGRRLVTYQAVRDRNERGLESMDINLMPRPANPEYLAYTAEAFKKARESGGRDLNPVELDAALTLRDHMKNLQAKDQAVPGEDEEFDRRFTAWLRQSASWVPLRLLIDADEAELVKAGYDRAKLKAFRDAYLATLDGEHPSPNQEPEKQARALVSAARDLGRSAGDYPSLAALERESHFNRLAPFYKAPMAYGAALALLLISLGISASPGSAIGAVDRALYGLGMLAIVAGIGLESYGFYLRVRISGWAPVTNMYETVIWVALITAVIGLVLELVYRRKYAAVAASGMALLGTLLAAGFPSIMDPNIKELQPVLRSNYWLAIHVLTEVSSYAAFALAMGLGLIGTLYYLTATYRRSVGYHELLAPLAAGLPLTGVGLLGYYASKQGMGPAWVASQPFSLAAATVFIAGGTMALAPISAILGELISRLTFRDEAALEEAAIADNLARPRADAMLAGAASAGGSATATLTRPSIDEIRARAAASRPKLDARGLAMQATASKVKPLANFIYRAMQVGVLLIAAGTILGGVWADYSWGRFWGWDPKEVWALITLLVYLVPLHGRFAGLLSTFGMIAASVACFLSVVMAWYGVNFVLGVGLHSYGFSEGGGQEGMALVITAVLSLVFGAYWRRRRASTPTAVTV